MTVLIEVVQTAPQFGPDAGRTDSLILIIGDAPVQMQGC
jgi:hypothetical protein